MGRMIKLLPAALQRRVTAGRTPLADDRHGGLDRQAVQWAKVWKTLMIGSARMVSSDSDTFITAECVGELDEAQRIDADLRLRARSHDRGVWRFGRKRRRLILAIVAPSTELTESSPASVDFSAASPSDPAEACLERRRRRPPTHRWRDWKWLRRRALAA